MNSHATIPVELNIFQREEIVIIQVREERILSEKKAERKETERPKKARSKK